MICEYCKREIDDDKVRVWATWWPNDDKGNAGFCCTDCQTYTKFEKKLEGGK